MTAAETVIEGGLKTFWQVGEALAKVRDGRLYRDGHGTFEDYCREKWDISRPRAYQFIESALAVKNLSTIVDKETVKESQVRPLVSLDTPEEQVRAFQAAIADAPEGKPTAKHVHGLTVVPPGDGFGAGQWERFSN